MKIGITGGTGILGRYLLEEIKKQGIHKAIVLSRGNSSLQDKMEVRHTDYTSQSLTKCLVDIDAVVHLAALRGHYNNIADYSENSIITQNLYDSCKYIGIKNIVHSSSISIYSDQDKIPWKENSTPNPQSFYGISKLDSEYIGNIYSIEGNLRIKNLRFAHIFGSSEKNSYMINRFMMQAYEKKTLTLYSNQKARREFLYARDASKALLFALDMKETFGTFNAGSGGALTNLEVAETINEAFENSGNLIILDNQEAKIDSSLMDNTLIKQMIGFEAKYSFYDAIKEIYMEMKSSV